VCRCGAVACWSCRGPDQDAIGKVVGGNGLHIPSYVADVAGIFKEEALRPLRLADRQGAGHRRPLRQSRFRADPLRRRTGGVERRGDPLHVGQSMSSQWVFVTRGDITKVEDLKGKTIGYGRLGSADYDEGATYLARFFNLQVGKDYKVIAFQGEPERIPALLNRTSTRPWSLPHLRRRR